MPTSAVAERPHVKRQLRRDEILAFITEYATAHHNAPSTLEIAAVLKISRITVYHHLMKLCAERRLEQLDGKWKVTGAEYIPPEN